MELMAVTKVGEDGVDGSHQHGRRTTGDNFDVFGSRPLSSPSSSLDWEMRKNCSCTKPHLYRLEAGQVLSRHRRGSISIVDAHIALDQSILSHGALSLTSPLQAIFTVVFTWAVVAIVFLLRQLHVAKLVIDDVLSDGSRCDFNSVDHGSSLSIRGRHDKKRVRLCLATDAE